MQVLRASDIALTGDPGASAGSPSRAGTLHGISALRAISSLLIATYHVTLNLRSGGVAVWFPFAQTPGVHLFLVISGFMLAYRMRANDTPVRFLLKRIGRIVPLYWVLTCVAILLVLWRAWLFPDADLSFAGIATSFLFLPHQDRAGMIAPILFVGWTLNYIVLNYVMFALAMFGPQRFRPYIAMALLVAFMCVGHFLPPGTLRTFSTEWRQIEFVFGLGAGVLLRDPRVGQWVRSCPMWPIALIGAVGLLLGSLSHLEGFWRTMACGIPAMVLVFALAGQDLYRQPVGDGLLPWLGRISYSIYLVHPLIIPLVGAAIVGHLGPPWVEGVLDMTVVYGLTIAIAALCYRFIETPGNNWVRSRVARFGAERISAAAQPSRPASAVE
jgi:exopolysaccharide production protein ExoZ